MSARKIEAEERMAKRRRRIDEPEDKKVSMQKEEVDDSMKVTDDKEVRKREEDEVEKDRVAKVGKTIEVSVNNLHSSQ